MSDTHKLPRTVEDWLLLLNLLILIVFAMSIVFFPVAFLAILTMGLFGNAGANLLLLLAPIVAVIARAVYARQAEADRSLIILAIAPLMILYPLFHFAPVLFT